MSDLGPWKASIEVVREDRSAADRLWATLSPEASREVPRAHATVERLSTTAVVLRLEAKDSGALRAALNTFLSWVGLALSTEAAGHDRSR